MQIILTTHMSRTNFEKIKDNVNIMKKNIEVESTATTENSTWSRTLGLR